MLTYVIGLGGTGSLITSMIKKRAQEAGVPQEALKIRCIDLSPDMIDSLLREGRLTADDVYIIERSYLEPINVLKEAAENLDWFPDTLIPELGNIKAEMGAGRRRPIGRFILRVMPAFNTIRDIIMDDARFLRGSIRSLRSRFGEHVIVWVVTALGGGTGSGIMIDVARLVKLVFTELQLDHTIFGLGVLPSGLRLHLQSPIYEQNAYAVLKELTFIMDREQKEEPEKFGLLSLPNQDIFSLFFLAGFLSIPVSDLIEAYEFIDESISRFIVDVMWTPWQVTEAVTRTTGTATRRGIDWYNLLVNIPNIEKEYVVKTARFSTFGIGYMSYPIDNMEKWAMLRSEIRSISDSLKENVPEYDDILDERMKSDIDLDWRLLNKEYLIDRLESSKIVFKNNKIYMFKFIEHAVNRLSSASKNYEERISKMENSQEERYNSLNNYQDELERIEKRGKKLPWALFGIGLVPTVISFSFFILALKLLLPAVLQTYIFIYLGLTLVFIAITILVTIWGYSTDWWRRKERKRVNIRISDLDEQIAELVSNIAVAEREKRDIGSRISISIEIRDIINKEIEESRQNLEKYNNDFNNIEETLLNPPPKFYGFQDLSTLKRTVERCWIETEKKIDRSRITLSLIKDMEGDESYHQLLRSACVGDIFLSISRIEFALKLGLPPTDSLFPIEWIIQISNSQNLDEAMRTELARIAGFGLTSGKWGQEPSQQHAEGMTADFDVLRIVAGISPSFIEDIKNLKEQYDAYPTKEELHCYKATNLM